MRYRLLLPAFMFILGLAPAPTAFAQDWAAISVHDALVQVVGTAHYVGSHTCEGRQPYPRVTAASNFRPLVMPGGIPEVAAWSGVPFTVYFCELVFSPTVYYTMAPGIMGWTGSSWFDPGGGVVGFSYWVNHALEDPNEYLEPGAWNFGPPTVGNAASSFYGLMNFADGGTLDLRTLNGPSARILYLVHDRRPDILPDRIDFTLVLSRNGLWPRNVADVNGDWVVDQSDLFDFLTCFFTGDVRADVDRSGSISTQDIWDFLAEYLS